MLGMYVHTHKWNSYLREYLILSVLLFLRSFVSAEDGAEEQPQVPLMKYVANYGGTINDTQKVGKYTFVAQGCVVRALDPSKSSREIGEISLSAKVESIEPYKSTLFAWIRNSEMVAIIDVRNPRKMKIVKPTGFEPAYRYDWAPTLEGDALLIIGSQNALIEAYDISNPYKPTPIADEARFDKLRKSQYELFLKSESTTESDMQTTSTKTNDQITSSLLSCSIDGVWVRENLAYLACKDGRMLVVDISEPQSSRCLYQWKLDSLPACMDVSRKYLAISDSDNKVSVYRKMKPDHRTPITTIQSPEKIQGLQIADQYLSLLLGDDNTETQSIQVYDVSTSPPKLVSKSNAHSPYDKRSMTGFGKLLKYSIFRNSYRIEIEHTDLTLLNVAKTNDGNIVPDAKLTITQPDYPVNAKVFDDNIYLLRYFMISTESQDFVDLLTLNSGSLGTIASSGPIETCQDFFVQGDYLYIAGGNLGLVILKIGNTRKDSR